MSYELDPHGTNPHMPGAKLDDGKVRAGLVLSDFPNALIAVAHVGTFGARKYTPRGWQSVPNAAERYEDAKVRHQLKRYAGQEFDSDSGLSHLAHEVWNALAVLELALRREL